MTQTQRKQAEEPPRIWLTGDEAAEIASANNGHRISNEYIRKCSQNGKILSWKIRPSMRLYRKIDIELLRVKEQQRISGHWEEKRKVRLDAMLACLPEQGWMMYKDWYKAVSHQRPNISWNTTTFDRDANTLVKREFVEQEGLGGNRRQYRKRDLS